MSVKILNDMVALKPIVFEHDKGHGQKMVAGFYGTDKLLKTVISSVVVFQSEGFSAGDVVYLRADIYNNPNAKNILKINDVEFIVIPKTLIIAKESNE